MCLRSAACCGLSGGKAAYQDGDEDGALYDPPQGGVDDGVPAPERGSSGQGGPRPGSNPGGLWLCPQAQNLRLPSLLLWPEAVLCPPAQLWQQRHAQGL